nr:unnamed protein product [Spirometra erinaceieuropaei]
MDESETFGTDFIVCPLLWLLLQWGILFVTYPYVAAGPAGPYLYAIWIFAIFFTLSGHFVIIPAACTRIFGPQNMATIYGLVYAATAPSALLAAAVISQFDVKGAWIAVYTACAVSCFIGRIIWGLLVDHFSYKCPLLWLLLQWGILFVTYPYVAAGPAGPYLYAIWIFAIFFTLSGHFVIIPAACTRIFGPQNMATIYGLVYAATGAWIAVYTACAVSCFIAFIISLFLKDEQVRCVGFTSAIAGLCDRCRGQLISAEAEMESPARVGVDATGDKAKEEEETAVF